MTSTVRSFYDFYLGFITQSKNKKSKLSISIDFVQLLRSLGDMYSHINNELTMFIGATQDKSDLDVYNALNRLRAGDNLAIFVAIEELLSRHVNHVLGFEVPHSYALYCTYIWKPEDALPPEQMQTIEKAKKKLMKIYETDNTFGINPPLHAHLSGATDESLNENVDRDVMKYILATICFFSYVS